MKPVGPTPKRYLGRLREVRVDLGVLPYYVWVVVGPRTDMERYIQFRRPDGCGLPSMSAEGCTWSPEGVAGPVIWLSKRNPAWLAHEALHAMHMVTQRLSIQLNDDSQEIYAYGVSHIVETVLKELKA